jgi:hypothetical protein
MKHQLRENRGKSQRKKRMEKERWGSEGDAPQAGLNARHAEFEGHVQYAHTTVYAPPTYPEAPRHE